MPAAAPLRASWRGLARESSKWNATCATYRAPRKSCARVLRSSRSIPKRGPAPMAQASTFSSCRCPKAAKFWSSSSKFPLRKHPRKNDARSARPGGALDPKARVVTSSPRAQDLRNAPRLRERAARHERRLPVKYFADAPDPVREQVMRHRLQKACCAGRIAIDAQVRDHERPQQPRPYRALMIGRVALGGCATIVTLIAWI